MSDTQKSLLRRGLWLIILSVIIVIFTILIILMPDVWFGVWLAIEPWLWLILSVATIIFVYELIIYFLKRYVRRSEKIPKDATNGLILIVRIIAVVAIMFVIMPALNISGEYLVDLSTIIATAIGIAATLAVSNLVAGFYMLSTHPYKVGDFISVDQIIEGIVKEIGLNYTKIQDIAGSIIQIPNNKLLSSNLINYNIEHTKRTDQPVSLEEKFVSVLSNILIKDEIVNYVFQMEFGLELDGTETIRILDEVCDRWTEKFGYRPHYYFKNLYWWGQLKWALMAEDAKTIMKLKDDFLEDVWLSIYKYKEVSNE